MSVAQISPIIAVGVLPDGSPTCVSACTTGAEMTAIEYLDRPPSGWFVLDVMRKEWRKWDWVALMIDVHPDDFISWKRNTSAPCCWVRISTRTWTPLGMLFKDTWPLGIEGAISAARAVALKRSGKASLPELFFCHQGLPPEVVPQFEFGWRPMARASARLARRS